MNLAAINNTALAAFNGSVLILALYCVVFIAIHLFQTGLRRHIELRRWFFRLPRGMQIAVGTFTVCLGEAATRTAVWLWRYWNGGTPDTLAGQGVLLGLGGVILAIGFLCILRIVTQPFGRWPVAAAVLTVLAYLASFL